MVIHAAKPSICSKKGLFTEDETSYPTYAHVLLSKTGMRFG